MGGNRRFLEKLGEVGERGDFAPTGGRLTSGHAEKKAKRVKDYLLPG